MPYVAENALAEATRLLAEIDDDHHHPANDNRHPEHEKCLKAYHALAAWCDEQRLLLEKERRQERYFNGEFYCD